MKFNFLSKLKIRTIFTLNIIIFSILFIILQYNLLFRNLTSFWEQEISRASLETSRQITRQIDYFISNLNETALNIRLNPVISDFIYFPPGSDNYSQILLNSDVASVLSGYANSSEGISSIYLMTNKLDFYYMERRKNCIYQFDRLKGDPLYSAITQQKQGFVATRPNNLYTVSQDENILTYFHNIYDKYDKFIASICISIDETYLKEILDSTQSTDSLLFIFDENGSIITPFTEAPEEIAAVNAMYSSVNELLKKGDANYTAFNYRDKEYLCIGEPMDNGWSLLQLRDYNLISSGIYSIGSSMGIVVVICLMINILFIYVCSKAITRPITALIEKIGQLGQNNLDVTFEVNSNNEIGSINYYMNIITGKLRKMIRDITQSQEELRKSELKALQSQINPHFLYNTLNAIHWMAVKKGAEDISNMTTQLAAFYRHSLNKGQSFTTIQSELEHLDAYVAIQSYRYRSSFTYIKNIDPEILPYITVNTVLQPLVENSLIHGAAGTNGVCTIHVNGTIRDGSIIIDVIDDGCGCNSEMINRCLNANIDMTKNYGIQNVNQRLKIFFGEQYGLTYLETETGTHVQVRLPMLSDIPENYLDETLE